MPEPLDLNDHSGRTILMPEPLDLNDLTAGDNPGITPEKGSELAQAGAVCLEAQGHATGAHLTVHGDYDNCYQLAWTPATPQARRTWNDDDEAIEDAAAGISVLLANRIIGQAVIVRARKSSPQHSTGFDYWLGDDRADDMTDAERAATESLSHTLYDANLVARSRLEVSGIRNGNDSVIKARVRRKLRQMRPSDALGLPGYAIIVEFGHPLAEVKRK